MESGFGRRGCSGMAAFDGLPTRVASWMFCWAVMVCFRSMGRKGVSEPRTGPSNPGTDKDSGS